MLWYKSWLETRWRFLIGLVLLMLSACGTVLAYPRGGEAAAAGAARSTSSGEIGRRVARRRWSSSRTYRGYVWSQWFRQNLPQMWALFAVLLGTGGLLSQASGGGALFTLSLPVSRDRLLGVRAATGLAELLVLAFVPSLLLPLLSPVDRAELRRRRRARPRRCACSSPAPCFFSLAFLLSTVFSDVWRPLLIALCVAVVLALVEPVVRRPVALQPVRAS